MQPQFVQGANGSGAAATFSSNNTAGNLLIAIARNFAGTASTISDSQGNNWVQQILDPVNPKVQIAYALNCKGGANTVTTSDITHDQIIVAEYSGVLSVSALDGSTSFNHAPSGTTSLTTGSITPTTNGDLIIAPFYYGHTGQVTFANGYSLEYVTPAAFGTTLGFADQIQTLAGAISWTGTILSGTEYLAGILAFKAKDTKPTTFRSFSDNFQRADQDPVQAPWTSVLGSFTIHNNGFAPLGVSHSGAGTQNVFLGLRLSDGVYQSNHSSQATISSIAPALATMNITAASFSSPSTTYTYSGLSGTAIFNNMDIVVAGMTNAGNNGDFVVSSFTGTTFTVTNASGVTESSSTGTGTASSDSLCGLCVRCTPDGLNGYYLLIGTNSGRAAGIEASEVYTREMWKAVNGVHNLLLTLGPPDSATSSRGLSETTTIIDSVNDIYKLSAIGPVIVLYKNGNLIAYQYDTALTSGYPGVSGQVLSNASPAVGNNGTVWTNWVGTDSVATSTNSFSVTPFLQFVTSDGPGTNTPVLLFGTGLGTEMHVAPSAYDPTNFTLIPAGLPQFLGANPVGPATPSTLNQYARPTTKETVTSTGVQFRNPA